ncbi:MAG TPA: hypothetical protein QGF58_24590 [Myxococcota bacterium]|nr:hypothetical protein [Myxococcota bacterium]
MLPSLTSPMPMGLSGGSPELPVSPVSSTGSPVAVTLPVQIGVEPSSAVKVKV